uniref:30S ribosomal protein 3, chloroplastic n=1 Tax=Trachelomonas grandis TaxID=215769 RepID=A0A385UK70_9EUGL|nr:putative ribosomal protein 3 [Trachelomonas grandis]
METNFIILRFLWLEKSIAVSLDYSVENNSFPLTEYYFWPQSDAWDDIRIFLENSTWITQSESIYLLNTLTEVINYWQDKNEHDLKNLENAIKLFTRVRFVNS